jgi:NADPH-dependent curcumin reductase CurA
MKAQRILLASRPAGMPTLSNFTFKEIELPNLKPGQVMVQTLYLSVDPYMRGRMNDQKSYVPPYAVGEVIEGGVIGRILASESSQYQAGDLVLGSYGWQTHAVVNENQIRPAYTGGAPVTTALGLLGMPGLTAYFGLLAIGKPQTGETVVVSGAAGAVGMVAGQIAKLKGARVVGIAGTQQKCEHLVTELGFDAAVNYRDADFHGALRRATAAGVDVYFDNVGGPVSDAVLARINKGARIPLCGQISLYNSETVEYGPRIQALLLINSALMQGFIVSNFADQFGAGIKELAGWISAGKMKYEETVVNGFDHTVDAFLQLFTGGNLGKMLVKVAD